LTAEVALAALHDEATVAEFYTKIGQLTAERDFLAACRVRVSDLFVAAGGSGGLQAA